ncbi:MAG: hypothetical protein KKC46_07020 [Proteobacteria bacterium]|nr:hypothetical protein [Pseudomonadota bacterium]
MKIRMFSIIFILLIPCFLFQYGRTAHGIETELSAEQIIDKYIEATGGKKAREKIYNSITEMKIKLYRNNTECNVTRYKQRPNRFYSILKIDIMGMPVTAEEAGINGDIVWKIEALTNGKILKGEERANFLIENAPDTLFLWRTYFKDVQYAGTEDINGKKCHKIVMIPFQGDKRTYFFDKDTYLVIKTIVSPPKINFDTDEVITSWSKENSGEGPLTQDDMLENYFSDYRKVDDILIPHNILQISGGYKIFNVEIKNFKTNIDMPKDRFDLPDKIKRQLVTK